MYFIKLTAEIPCDVLYLCAEHVTHIKHVQPGDNKTAVYVQGNSAPIYVYETPSQILALINAAPKKENG